MEKFDAILSRFERHAEKTGWTYIIISESIAQKINPGNRKTFRVKGRLDRYILKSVAVLPMGDGNYIMPVNATMRKGIGKRIGAMVHLEIEADHKPPAISKDLLDCLEDDPDAKTFFFELPMSHRNYYSKWVDTIKNAEGRAQRIAEVLFALSRKWNFPEMRKYQKSKKEG